MGDLTGSQQFLPSDAGEERRTSGVESPGLHLDQESGLQKNAMKHSSPDLIVQDLTQTQPGGSRICREPDGFLWVLLDLLCGSGTFSSGCAV